MSRRSFDRRLQYETNHPYIDESRLRRWEDLPSPLATSAKWDDCLSHLIRWAHAFGDRLAVTCECGNGYTESRLVPIADETFLCARCHQVAEHIGRDTYGLIPDGGCAVSGGRRGTKAIRR